MTDDPCSVHRRDLEAALMEWRRFQHGGPEADQSAGSRMATPRMAGQLGSRFHETIGRREAAQRRYRSAVRALSECLRESS